METATEDAVLDLVARWSEAELRGDVDAYGSLLTDDFQGIGPVGFVLDKTQWAMRHRQDLVNEEFEILEPSVRTYGDTAVVVGIQRQKTRARGHDATGSFRVGLVAVRHADAWLIAGIQLSGPLAAPGAAPPFPRAGERAQE